MFEALHRTLNRVRQPLNPSQGEGERDEIDVAAPHSGGKEGGEEREGGDGRF
jgi:hypothetical protein